MSSPIRCESSPTPRPSENRNFVTALRCGLLGGLAVSYVLYSKNFLCSKNQNLLKGTESSSPLPLIFTGMLGVAVIEGIGLAYEVAKRVLGERSLFENISTKDVKVLLGIQKLRYRAWKVIFWLEQRVEIVDKIYSRIFRIRTEKEIIEKEIPKIEFSFMEIVRVAFKKQLKETMNEAYPTTGYTSLLFNFTLAVTDKINKISNKIQKKKIKEQRKIEQREADAAKAWCLILDAWADESHQSASSSNISSKNKKIPRKVKAVIPRDSREVKNATT